MQNEIPSQPHSNAPNHNFSEAQVTLVSLGERIRTARLRRNLNAKDVAKSVGISMPTLRKLERGKPTITVGVLARVLLLLNLLSTLNAVALDAALAHIPPTLRKRARRKSTASKSQRIDINQSL